MIINWYHQRKNFRNLRNRRHFLLCLKFLPFRIYHKGSENLVSIEYHKLLQFFWTAQSLLLCCLDFYPDVILLQAIGRLSWFMLQLLYVELKGFNNSPLKRSGNTFFFLNLVKEKIINNKKLIIIFFFFINFINWLFIYFLFFLEIYEKNYNQCFLTLLNPAFLLLPILIFLI